MSIISSDSAYLVGIGGIGMANLAVLLKESGLAVAGSDENLYEPAAGILHEAGIEVHSPYAESNLPAQTCPIVIGNALSRGHIEVEATLRRRLPLYSFPEILGRQILAGRQSCVVAGTHGKSTTSACLAYLLSKTNQHPGYLIGARPLDFSTGAALGTGSPFVVEGDEYDSAFFDKRSKFIHYFPQILALGRVEFDHADIFKNLDEVLLTFRRLINLLPDNGSLVYDGTSEHCLALAREARCRTWSVGFDASCDWQLIRDKNSFLIRSPDHKQYEFLIKQPGAHNRLNSLIALASANAVHENVQGYLEALASFRGIRRRLEKLYENEHLIVYDDFAHHPTAVQAAIRAVKETHPDHQITAVFEPRSNTSVRKFYQNEFTEALALADSVVIGSIHRQNRIPESELLDPNLIATHLRDRGKTAVHLENPDIIDYLLSNTDSKPAVILFMSNGSFDGVQSGFLNRVRHT
jgi:UDP-N-acetylmuramate: L-alanyl-gamma-D-glutamyl-meso-diaminopimelate ligase